MNKLITEPNIPDGDGFYAKLLGANEGLSEAETNLFNARLVLILSNHIGEQDILDEAIEMAKKVVKP